MRYWDWDLIGKFLVFVLVVLFFIFFVIPEMNKIPEEELKTTEVIYSIKETENSIGWFIIAVGVYKEREYYHYYIETEKGLQLKRLRTNETIYFTLDDDETTRVEKWYGKEGVYYKIFLPKDAIIKQFNVG